MASTKKKSKRAEGLPAAGWVGLGAVVLLLVVLVIWSLPKDGAPTGDADAAHPEPSSAPTTASSEAGGKTTGTLERLPEATCELAVLTDKPEDTVKALASAEAINKLFDIRHCGTTCDLAKKSLLEKGTEIEVMKAEDFILPPPESFTAIAPGLTPDERERAAKVPLTLVIRTRDPATIDQSSARGCFAGAAAAAEALGGFVYDEAGRRIETPTQFASHTIVAAAGQPVFRPRQITIQQYRQDDGTARLLTLGMARYASPDFIARGATMDEAPRIAHVINAVAYKAAKLDTKLPFTVSLADVALVSGRKPAELAKDANASKPVSLDVVEAERAEGDPDNDIVELVPSGGASAEGWSALLGILFGDAPAIVKTPGGPELDRVAAKAKKDLPDAIKRWKAGEGSLFVKGPFDGGDAGPEWMWIEVTSCDRAGCNGILANEPGYASNLAQGKNASVTKDKTADWMIQLRDGGTAGGESTRILTKP